MRPGNLTVCAANSNWPWPNEIGCAWELADVRGSSAGALGFSSALDTSTVLPEPVEPA